jgi:hypothetical protein
LFISFPPPWSVHHSDDAYWVQDANGRKFGFVYFDDRPVIGTGQEARRLVSNFAKLPELLGATKRSASLKRSRLDARSAGPSACGGASLADTRSATSRGR